MFKPLIRRFTGNHRLVNSVDFIFKILLIYAAWKIFFFLVSMPSFPLHTSWVHFNDWLAGVTIIPVAYIFKHWMGYKLIYNQRNIIISGTQGLFLANHCLGIAPMVIFAGFILAYKGKWIHKLWYIPAGILFIYGINVLRMLALAQTEVCCSMIYFELAHSWVYLFLSYGMFFLLVALWMNVFSRK